MSTGYIQKMPGCEDLLRIDEQLLAAEDEAIRFWDSPVYGVVLGRSCKADDDVYLEACAMDGVPVMRRSSGGGTVLQGPGCLNYSLVLSLERRPELLNICESYKRLLAQVSGALRVPGLKVRGSDILLGDKKVSGSAQRRTRGWVLHQGTLLLGMDVRLIERYLKEPRRQPAHREGRQHADFIGQLSIRRQEVIARLTAAFRKRVHSPELTELRE